MASEAHRSRGNAAFAAGAYAEAVRHYGAAAAVAGDDVRPLGNRSAALAKLGRFGEALADAERGLRLRPRWAKGHARRGLALFHLGRLHDAEEAFLAGLRVTAAEEGCRDGLAKTRELLALGADDRQRARALFKTGRHALAAALYERCATRATEHGTTPNEAATLLSNASAARAAQGDNAAALTHAEAALALRPGWPKAWARKAVAAYALGRHGDARRAYERALALDPANAEYARALRQVAGGAEAGEHKADGDKAFAAGEHARAAECYTRALQHAPKGMPSATLLSNRSACRAKLGEWPAALADARSALAHAPAWPKAHCRAVAAQLGAGEAEEAYWAAARGVRACEAVASAAATSRAEVAQLEAKRSEAFGALCRWQSPRARRRAKRWAKRDAARPRERTRVFVCSDLHVDKDGQIGWCASIDPHRFRDDVLLVAGDVGDTVNAIRQGLRELKAKFRRVFYVPGNHDLWLRPGLEDAEYPDSICKLLTLFDLCDDLGVEMAPAEVARGMFVVPLLSWYNYHYDEYDPTPGRLHFDAFAKWPVHNLGAWELMLKLNVAHVRPYKRAPDDRVFTLSHFLPYAGLPYPKASCSAPEMAKAVGCTAIGEQADAVGSDMHAFGHTHMNEDSKMPGGRGARVVQYAIESTGAADEIYCVFDRGHASGKTVRTNA